VLQNVCLAHSFYRDPGGEDVVFLAERDVLLSHGIAVQEFTQDNREFEHLTRWRQASRLVWNQPIRRGVRHTLRRTKAQLLHCHNIFPAISPSIYAAAADVGIPVVQTLHNFRLLCANPALFRDGKVCELCLPRPFGWPGIVHACYRGSHVASAVLASMTGLHWLRGTWQESVTTYIALTEFSRQKFIEGGLPGNRIVVKPNFVSDPGFVSDVGTYALFVGRLSPEKGLHTLLQAWKELGGKIPLQIAGGGPLSQVMTSLPESVTWHGRVGREDVRKLMAGARLLVFPSECYENFPLVLIEAFAAGLPVIASDHGAAVSIVAHGETGLRFRPGDWQDLVRRVTELWDNRTRLKDMRLAARREYVQKYAPEVNFRLLVRIYENAVNNTVT